jgi:hypothetical protein
VRVCAQAEIILRMQNSFPINSKKNSFPDEKLAGFHLNETEFGKELASHAIRRQVD